MLFDSVVRAPLIGSMLMALTASLIGVLLFVRKRTLIGETLAHASYPGVTLAILLSSEWMVLLGAFVFGFLGFLLVNLLKRFRVKEDTALTFVLSTFFGMGTLVASIIQQTHPLKLRQVQVFLYGQAATMSDHHILIYALFALLVISLLLIFYRPLLASSFDRSFALTANIGGRGTELLFLTLVTLAVVMGIRSVGVIMMSALFIAPPVAARQFTNRLGVMLCLSACFGVASGFFGTLLSLSGLPTGPMIVIIASSIALFALLFAPKRGVVVRYTRVLRFRYHSHQENLLKALWRKRDVHLSLVMRLVFLLRGWVDTSGALTPSGERQGAKVVRLHRLWEAYLVYSLGMGIEQVHHSAEEMEHLLTKELEEELTKLLNDPTLDPHEQPIPSREVLA